MEPSLRPAEDPDADAIAALRLVVTPYQVFTAAAIRHGWATSPERAKALVLVAEADGQVIATGRTSLDTWTSEPGVATVFVMVHPAYRGRGIGSRLYAALAEHLHAVGARKLRGWAVDDPATAGFVAARGFARTHELRFSSLSLAANLPDMPAVPEGVTFASFTEAGPRDVFAVDAAAMVDEPGDVAADALDYDEWVSEIWSGPDYDFDASTLVYVDGAPASYTLVGVDRATGRMWSDGTGTVREHRRKGLAKLAKSVAVRKAAASGITVAYASNDEENAPILAINGWLGYQPCATQWSYVKTPGMETES